MSKETGLDGMDVQILDLVKKGWGQLDNLLRILNDPVKSAKYEPQTNEEELQKRLIRLKKDDFLGYLPHRSHLIRFGYYHLKPKAIKALMKLNIDLGTVVERYPNLWHKAILNELSTAIDSEANEYGYKHKTIAEPKLARIPWIRKDVLQGEPDLGIEIFWPGQEKFFRFVVKIYKGDESALFFKDIVIKLTSDLHDTIIMCKDHHTLSILMNVLLKSDFINNENRAHLGLCEIDEFIRRRFMGTKFTTISGSNTQMDEYRS